MKRHSWMWLLAMALAAGGCPQGESEDDDVESQAEEAAPAEPEEPDEEPDEEIDEEIDEELAARQAWEARTGELASSIASAREQAVVRAVTVETARGDPRSSYIFAFTNESDSTTRSLYAPIHLYDDEGEVVEVISWTTRPTIEPGETEEVEFDMEGTTFERPVAAAEAEVVRVEYEDGSEWRNQNLRSRSRPRGGLSEDALRARSGEIVIGEWSGGFDEDDEMVFWLTNIADEPVEAQSVVLIAFDAAGENISSFQVESQLRPTEYFTMNPGETIEWAGVRTREDLEEASAEPAVVEATVSRAVLGGSDWRNANLNMHSRQPRSDAHYSGAQPQ